MTYRSGLANCHLPGLYSLVLSERISDKVGMRRIFYCGPNCDMDLWAAGDFCLKPHNHRQSIRLTLLCGEVTNYAFTFLPPFIGFGELARQYRVWCYLYGSALLGGKFSLQRAWREDVLVTAAPLSREPLYLHSSAVHTVTAKPGSAWLVEELELATGHVPHCFSLQPDLSLSSEGLYVPMRAAELAEMPFFTITQPDEGATLCS